MFRLECSGCHTIHEVEERRIPSAGLKMRCTRCGTSLWVRLPQGEGEATGPAAESAALPVARATAHQVGLPAVVGEVAGLPMSANAGVRTAPTVHPPRPSALGLPIAAAPVRAGPLGTSQPAAATRRPPPVAPRPRSEDFAAPPVRPPGQNGGPPSRREPEPAPARTLELSEPEPSDWDLPSAWSPPPPAGPAPPLRIGAPAAGPLTPRPADADELPAVLRGGDPPMAARDDADGDLPAVLGGSSGSAGHDLPAVLGGSSSSAGHDLPAVLGGSSSSASHDLPAVLGGSSGSAGHDLPAVLGGSSGSAGHDLPAVLGGSSSGTGHDLPAVLGGVRGTAGLPAARGAAAPRPGPAAAPPTIDRPRPAAPATTAARAGAAGGVAPIERARGAAPSPPLDDDALPAILSSAQQARSATTGTGAFGELDLPLLAAEPPVLSAPLPVLSNSEALPTVVAAGLPALAAGADTGASADPNADRDWLSLPPIADPSSTAESEGQPSQSVPVPHTPAGTEFTLEPRPRALKGGGSALESKAQSSPARDQFGEFELPDGDQGIPLILDAPVRASGPAPSDLAKARGLRPTASVPAAARPRGADPSPARAGGAAAAGAPADGEVTDLTDEVSFTSSSVPPPSPSSPSSSEIPVDDDMEFGAIPQGDGQAVALDALPPSSGSRGTAAADSKQAVAPARKRRRLAVVAVTAGGVLLGASLEVVGPYGAFGRHLLSDTVHAEGYRALQAATIDGARRLLVSDVYADATHAVSLTEEAFAKAPRVTALLAYGAYLGYMNELRFGRNPSTEAHARQQLARLGDDPTFHAELARVAETAVGSRIPRARQQVETLGRGQPRDPDVILLSAELALVAKEPSKALEEFRKAEEILGPTGRTAFGIARACWAAGDEPHALEAARTTVERSHHHAAARVLLARVLWARGDEPEALSVLREVTAPGPIREAASQVEVVDGLTLTSRIHMARSRMSQAEAALTEALRIDAKSAAALAGMGEVLYREGRYTDALAKFDAGILADPEGVQAKLGSAKAKIALERLQEAKEQLKKLRDARQTDPEVSLWLGRAEEALGDKPAAEKSYQEAILVGGTKPEVVDAYMELAQLMVRDGRTTEADTVLAEARRKLPASRGLHQGLGEVHFQAGRFEAAKAEFEAAVQQDPQDLAARFRLAITLRHMSKFEAASAEFDRIAARDPQYPGLALERGLLYEATNRLREALDYYQEALAKAPDDPDLLLRVGSAEVVSGHASQAEEILRKVIAKRPNSADVNHYLGRALLLKGSNLAEGLRFLQRAVEIDANRAEYHLYVGWAANEAGQPGLARQALDRALELDKGLADAYWQKGELLRKQSAIVDAMRFAEKALELRPSRFEAYATMAQCYQDQNRTTEAISAWRKAITANDNVAEWHYRLGKLLGRTGEPELSKAVQLSELMDAKPGWLAQAYFELAESEQASGKRSDAIQHFRRFLSVAKPDSPYRPDALKALTALGSRYDDE